MQIFHKNLFAIKVSAYIGVIVCVILLFILMLAFIVSPSVSKVLTAVVLVALGWLLAEIADDA